MRRSAGQHLTRLTVVLLLGVAAVLRLFRIDAQSLWSDEGNSVAMAPRALLDIVQRTARDIHPPLYYLTLHGWTALFGTSEAAVRSLSALFGVATVALTAALGHRLGGRRVALLAALPAAVAPFAIHYSQEARMYMMVAMLGAASWLTFLAILRTEQSERRITPAHAAYFGLTLAMLYTHYYAVSLLLAQNLVWLWQRLQTGIRDRGRWGEWLGLQVGLVALYLPWIWYARRSIFGWPAVSPEVSLGFIARESLRIFSLGLANEGLTWWAAAGFGLLLLAGTVISLRRALGGSGGERAPHALLYFLTPLLLMYLLSLDRPFWNPKFLLLALPGYHLLLASGAAALLGRVERWDRRLVPPLALAAMLFFPLAAAPTLHNEYWEPAYWRDDYRGITRMIEAQEAPADAVLLSGGGQQEIFDYYYDGELPRYPLPASRPIDREATVETLQQIAQKHDRLYAVWWAEEEGDPAGIIPGWLAENAFQAGSRWFGDVRLEIYRLGKLPAPEPVDRTFTLPETDATLQLQGVSVEPETVVAGQVIALNSHWAARNLGEVPVTFFGQLLDAQNRVIDQYDGDGGAPPPAGWSAGETGTVRFGVPVPAGTAPGEYRLIIGAYHAESGQRFVVEDADFHSLGTIRVEAPAVPPPVEALALDHDVARNVSFGEARLVGARANKLGFDHAPETPIGPGEPFSLLLFWQAEQAAPALPALRLRLLDEASQMVTEWDYRPVAERYPPSQWQKRALVRDPQIRFMPADLPSGRYHLVLESEAQQAQIATLVVP